MWSGVGRFKLKKKQKYKKSHIKSEQKSLFINKDHTFWQYDHPTWFAPSLFFFLTFFCQSRRLIYFINLYPFALCQRKKISYLWMVCVANVGYSSDNIPIWFSLIYDFRRTPKRLKWNQKTKCWFFMSYYTFSWSWNKTSYVAVRRL